MSLKNKLQQSWHRYLKTNFQSYMRSAPLEGKERLYKHADIQNEFEKHEKERRRQRLQLIEYKQKLKKKTLEKEIALVKSLEEQKIAFIEGKEIKLEKAQLEDEKRDNMIKELEEINNTLIDIEKERAELKVVEQSIEELEPDMVILRGIEKKTVITLINYYEFQNRHIAGLELNPETIKNLEVVHYHVINNLPIKRERIYEVAPELFRQEIGELEEYKQRLIEERRPQLKVQVTSVLQVSEKEVYDDIDEDPIKIFINQEREMLEFVFNKGKVLVEKHHDWITMKLNSGYQNLDLILENLLARDEKELVGEDLEVLLELKELFKIQDDYHQLQELNRIRIEKEQRKLEMPEFVKNHPVLNQAWTERWEQFIKNSGDFSESILIPHNNYESQLDRVMKEQRKFDIQSLIEESQKKIKEKVGGTAPLRLNDRKQKDDELVKQVSVMTDMMHQVPDQQQLVEQKKEQYRLQYKDDKSMAHKSEERRILLSELPKVLFLNNKDSKTYNLHFWAAHFNIEPQKLRNIFNYITYPIINEDGPAELTKILKFIY